MRCAITLTPHMPQGDMVALDVSLRLEGFSCKAGGELFRAQLETVSIPGCTPENLLIADDTGDVPFSTGESKPYPYHFLHHTVSRDTVGTVRIAYTLSLIHI